MPNTASDIAIIGAGAWGLNVAYHLSKNAPDLKVTVLERRDQVALETTKQAAGQVGHLRSSKLMMDAIRQTVRVLNQLREEDGVDSSYVQSGSVHLALNDQRYEAFRRQREKAIGFGLRVDLVKPSELPHFIPRIDPSVVQGAIHVPDDGYVDAYQYALALHQALQGGKTQFLFNADVESIESLHGGAIRITTSKGVHEASRVAVTAGPWVRKLLSNTDFQIPMYPIRLQQVRTEADPERITNHPVVRIPDHSCYLRPEGFGYLYGYFDSAPLAMDPAHLPSSWTTSQIEPPVEVMQEAQERLTPLMPILGKLTVEQRRQGLVTCTPDGNYLIGPLPGQERIWVATGCGAMGIAGSGAVGRWVGDALIHGQAQDDLSPFALDRFGDRFQNEEDLKRICREVCASYYAMNSITYTL